MTDFVPYPKVPRLSRDVVITEKLDGSNAQVLIVPGLKYFDMTKPPAPLAVIPSPVPSFVAQADLVVLAGSRNRFVTPDADNYGFASWVKANAPELVDHLGEGQHFGEWWGRGINRNYSLPEKRFSLFNVKRWGTHDTHQGRVGPCYVVPTLYTGEFDTNRIRGVMAELKRDGSRASPGFMNPEGIMIYHTAANQLFKKTFETDEQPKGKPVRPLDAFPGATETTMGAR